MATPPKDRAYVMITKTKRTRDAPTDPSPCSTTVRNELGPETRAGSARYNTRSRKQLASYHSDSDDSIDIHSNPSSSPSTKSDVSETSSTSLQEFLDAQDLVYKAPRRKISYDIQGYLEGIGDLKPKDVVVMFPRPVESPMARLLRRIGPYLEVFIVIFCAVCLGHYISKYYL